MLAPRTQHCLTSNFYLFRLDKIFIKNLRNTAKVSLENHAILNSDMQYGSICYRMRVIKCCTLSRRGHRKYVHT